MPTLLTILLFLQTLTPFAVSGPIIDIAQPRAKSPEYQQSFCNYDAAEVVEVMRSQPAAFDFNNVRVLALSNVGLGREWAFHFAVFDGKGFIYDPGLESSNSIRPVRLREYLKRVANARGGRTEIRALDPARFLEVISDKNQLRVFYLFCTGMADAKPLRQFDVSEADWNELPPIQTPSTIGRWLAKGQFEPWTVPALPANVHTIFPRAKRRPKWYSYRDPRALLNYCRHRSTLVETTAAAAWAWLDQQKARAYFDLVLKHESHFPRERMDKFDLDRVFRGTRQGRAWRTHALRAFLRSCEGPLSR